MFKSSFRVVLRHVLRLFLYGAAGVALAFVTGLVMYLESRPDLDHWHLADLDEEFTAESEITSLADYLALEERLFEQLDDRVYDRTGLVGDDRLNRYKRDSLSDPSRWTPNWNRTFELSAPHPRASALLLHGLSDAPYSLRAIGQRLNQDGAHVLGLRIPGHGTAPSGLVTATWQDMAAAVRLAAGHLASENPRAPLYIVGYSNGAALAVHYALRTMDDPTLPRVDRLVLLSPEIGVTPTAAFAIWQARLGHWLGLDKLAWNSIDVEYDPFKYGSFAINAGDVSYRITAEIQRLLLSQRADGGDVDGMPPILAFTSAVDDTVSAPALVEHLFNRLAPGPHELVVYDINRVAGVEHFLRWSPEEMIGLLRQKAGRSFTLGVVTNVNGATREVLLRQWAPEHDGPTERPLGLSWPEDVYSLSHIALPFPPDDPLYGGRPGAPSPGVYLGDIARHGERGVLRVTPAAMLRLRWNPFYGFQENRIVDYLGLGAPEPASPEPRPH